MQLDPNETIVGLPILKIRDFLRKWENGWTVSHLAAALRIGQRKADQLLRELQHRDYIQRDEVRGNPDFYKLTPKGETFRVATGARPLTRKTAERKLSEFMARVTEVNSSAHFAYRVRKVIVFGSYLSSRDKLGDIDIAVELTPREQNHSKQEAVNDERIFSAESAGRRFGNIVDRLYWPQYEVALFLKARSRAISLHTTDDKAVSTDKFKVLYEMP